MKQLFYGFISHGSVVEEDAKRISEMMSGLNYSRYLLFHGCPHIQDTNNIKYIKCDDSYAGLPSKINSICRYVSLNIEIDFLVKVDRTVTIHNIFDPNSIPFDYCGKTIPLITGKYHYKKCEPNSVWYRKEFIGPKIYYCSGGGYILSKKSLNIISKDDSYNDHIYEDYYVGYILKKHNIEPNDFSLKNYLYDSDHPWVYS